MIYKVENWLFEGCYYFYSKTSAEEFLKGKNLDHWWLESIEMDDEPAGDFTKQALAWRGVGVTQEMPGTNGGFSMVVFNGKEVPVGTKIYVVEWSKE